MTAIRLGVNIDHVATVRNARGDGYPDPVRAAILAVHAGADGITAHLREDRRHITDKDIKKLKQEITVPLNFEMAATEEMIEIALETKPNACCIVPEKRKEITTEGGLDVVGNRDILRPAIWKLKEAGIKVSLFVDPSLEQITCAKSLGADVVEIHTGVYCNAEASLEFVELLRIKAAAEHAEKLGIECHAGHGLDFDTVPGIAGIRQVVELNIGHFLISEAIFIGLEAAVRKMKRIMLEAREGI